ncbi:MAG: hypothetical protein IBX72_15200 [Nitrospirae bacterium]|nr:hypothetical protein [Nitrospirota bacterium]
MKGIEKQKAGFRFGKHKLQVIKDIGSVYYRGKCYERTYKLVRVKTSSGELYYSLRLYNGSGRFIKQFLFEEQLCKSIALLLVNTEKQVDKDI